MASGGAPIPECLISGGDNCQPVQFQILCDTVQSFLRRYLVNCDNGDVVAIDDFELDGQTPYVTVGAVTVCDSDALDQEVKCRQLCDLGAGGGLPGFQVTFLRIEIRNSDGTLDSFFDVEADGVTPYVVVGPVDFECDCLECLPETVSARREHFEGIFSWVMPADVTAVTVKVRAVGAAGSVTIEDNNANVTPMFVGDEETWDGGDNTLAQPFTVAGANAGDIVTIIYEVIV